VFAKLTRPAVKGIIVNMQIPDVSGFKLSDAIRIIESSGIKIGRIKVAAPPRCKDLSYNENFRVIRLEVNEYNEVELLVCNPLRAK
jgi:hypothetical protein